VQIIVVDKRLARAHTLTFTRRHALVALSAAVLVVLMMSGMFSFLTVRVASTLPIPLVSDLISFVTRDAMERQDQRVRDNVAALARKLGEVQVQLLRLDALGERVSRTIGIRPEEFRFQELPGRGGALPGSDSMTLQDLDAELRRFTHSVEQRADYLAIVEAEVLSVEVRQALLPNSKPVSDGFIGSGFGWRTDPFTGEMARHEGVDFAAPPGTPIHAAAGGVVLFAQQHPVYGNMVEIDHGNALMTRYAHASRLHVRPGDLVKRGQKVAEVGSTGRSTGPHLHFEVHSKGVAQNPSKFLLAANGVFRLPPASTARGEPKALAAAANAPN
jgi:murein DD-endopeptidase MepM/ murein hydrolase activator NlpD